MLYFCNISGMKNTLFLLIYLAASLQFVIYIEG